MYCNHCGNKIETDEKYCTSCGKKVVHESEHIEPKKKYRAGLVFMIIIVTIIGLIALNARRIINLQSSYIYATEDEAVNIITNLIEMVGRQGQAWTKSEGIVDIYEYAFTPECLYSEECITEASVQVTTLKAEIQKETEEISNLWNKGTVSEDLKSFYASLEDYNQLKIQKILNLYFPDEEAELGTISATLL